MIVAPRVCPNGHFVPVTTKGSGRGFCSECNEPLAVEVQAAVSPVSTGASDRQPAPEPLRIGDPV